MSASLRSVSQFSDWPSRRGVRADASRPHVRNVPASCVRPQATLADPATPIRITGSLEPKGALRHRETVTVAGGTSQGVKPGQLYLVRRAISIASPCRRCDRQHVISVHTVAGCGSTTRRRMRRSPASCRRATASRSATTLCPTNCPVWRPPAAGQRTTRRRHIISATSVARPRARGHSWCWTGSDHGIKPAAPDDLSRDDGRTWADVHHREATALVVGAESTMIDRRIARRDLRGRSRCGAEVGAQPVVFPSTWLNRR